MSTSSFNFCPAVHGINGIENSGRQVWSFSMRISDRFVYSYSFFSPPFQDIFVDADVGPIEIVLCRGLIQVEPNRATGSRWHGARFIYLFVRTGAFFAVAADANGGTHFATAPIHFVAVVFEYLDPLL